MKTCSRSAAFLAVAIILCSWFSVTSASSVPENKPGKGDAAPSFTTTDLEGNKVVLEEINKAGKVVMLNFWGLRCSSCIEEIGFLNPLAKKFADKGVVFLGVNVDGAKTEIIRKLMPNMQHVPAFTVIPDPEFKVSDSFNLAGAPLSFVIGKDGVIRYRHEDFKPGDQVPLEEAIQKAIDGN